MLARCFDLPILKNNNLVSGEYRAKAVGDDQDRSPLDKASERLLDQGLRFWVQMGGGFVEDENRRVFEEGARHGDSLGLPGAQTGATLADLRGVPLWQLLDETVCMCQFCRSDDFI